MTAKRNIARLLLSAIVFIVCAELVGLVWYYRTTGTLFYLHRPDPVEPPAAGDRLAIEVGLHPYVGFGHVPNARFHDERSDLLVRDGWPAAEAATSRTNNVGFISPYPYPFEKTRRDQFVVGIFGGSVGMWFCQVGAPALIDRLKAHPFFKTREIVPLCFSFSGYKQPQLAILLAYFLSIGQQFDLVVNIDGFNDVALGAVNDNRGFDISMPSMQHLEGMINIVSQSTLTPEKLQSLAALVRDRQRLTNVTRALNVNRSAAVDFVLNAYYSRVRARYTQEQARFDALPSNQPTSALVQVLPPLATRDRSGLFTDIAAMWTRSSVAMRDLLRPYGGAYLHVLQPNQYYTKHTFTAAEADVALDDASPYKPGVEEGYPALQAAARSMLIPQGVAFVDATGAFDAEPSAVYIDDCCHYTLKGNDILAAFIAQAIVNAPGPWRR